VEAGLKAGLHHTGEIIQASLAMVGGLFGLLAYISVLEWRWLATQTVVGAVLFFLFGLGLRNRFRMR
jgi:hypothetical protein